LMTLTKWRKQRLFADFDRVRFAPAANFPTLPISKNAGKLLKGATVAYVLVTLASLLLDGIARRFPAAGNILILFVLWFACLRIAEAWFFREADALERMRWKRFWRGGVLLSVFVFAWIMGAVMFADWPPALKHRLFFSVSHRPWTGLIALYLGLYLVGLLGGFYNVRRCDKKDKKRILDCFHEWRLRQTSQTL
jgi:hypothetical protein